MEIITNIINYIIFLFIGMVAVGIFIQTNKELWNEIGKDCWNDTKEWFKNTKIGMWYNNKKNGVKILSEREYNRILKKGIVRIIEVEQK